MDWNESSSPKVPKAPNESKDRRAPADRNESRVRRAPQNWNESITGIEPEELDETNSQTASHPVIEPKHGIVPIQRSESYPQTVTCSLSESSWRRVPLSTNEPKSTREPHRESES